MADDLWIKLDAARALLAKDQLSKAKTKIERATKGAAGATQLLVALHALMSLESMDCDVPALFVIADDNAKTYWDSPGPYRSCAIAIRILARLAFADWLASHGDIKLATGKLAEAKSMALIYPVDGIEVIAKRIQAAARRRPTLAAKPRKIKKRAKAALAKAKSWKRGTLTAKELVTAAKLVKRSEITEMASAMDDYAGNAFLWEGDLVIDGDFCTTDADVTLLIVQGDLIVSGLYDAPDEHSFVIVTGSLCAADIITASSLDVFGDVKATGVVIGDYNDGGAHIRGNLYAGLFAPTDHPFRIDGKVKADFTLPRDKPKKGETAWEKISLAEPHHVDDVIGRLRKGLPILRVERR